MLHKMVSQGSNPVTFNSQVMKLTVSKTMPLDIVLGKLEVTKDRRILVNHLFDLNFLYFQLGTLFEHGETGHIVLDFREISAEDQSRLRTIFGQPPKFSDFDLSDFDISVIESNNSSFSEPSRLSLIDYSPDLNAAFIPIKPGSDWAEMAISDSQLSETLHSEQAICFQTFEPISKADQLTFIASIELKFGVDLSQRSVSFFEGSLSF